MALPSQDKHFNPKSVYQAAPLLVCFSYCPNLETALDIGAHVGYTARIMGVRFKRVICFEPALDLIPFLRQNVPFAEIHPFALGAEHSWGKLHRPKAANTGSGEVHPGNEFEIRRLDDCDVGQVDFIKIDVQGMELDVLKGGEKTIVRDKPLIFCEGTDDCEAERWLRRHGAYICARVGQDFLAGWNSFCTHGAFKQPL